MSSPRRGGSEESILEVLERDTVRTRALPGRSRFGWYVSGSVLAGFLVSLLVWLARESPDVRQMEAVLAADTDRPAAVHAATDSADADEGPAMSHGPAAPKAATAGMAGAAASATSPATASGASGTAAMTARASTANHAAIIDEQRPSSRKQDTQQHLPPIVLATPGLLGAVPPAQSGSGAVVQDEAADVAAKPAPASTPATAPDERKQPASPQAQHAQPSGGESRPAAAAAPDPASAAAPAAEPQQPAKQSSTDTPRGPASAKARTSNKVQSASVRSKPRKLARNTGKAKRTAATAAQAEDAQADSDVALISAVIQHATNRPVPGCADAECAAKATPQQ